MTLVVSLPFLACSDVVEILALDFICVFNRVECIVGQNRCGLRCNLKQLRIIIF